MTVDFEGKIDGETFQGGKAEDFQFIVGEGQMLKEFEDAVRGLKAGDSRTFPLSFPADYHGKDVAGKQADFMVTVKKIEASHLPEVNEQLAKSLGIADATVEGLRADIKKNLEREVKFRLLARNKNAVMDALMANAELDLPKASVQSEIDRMVEGARAELKQRGIKDADKAPIPDDVFRPQAERRVRLGLVVAELVRANEPAGQARADQGPHRRAGRQLREAGRRRALVLQRQPPPGRGRGRGDREQRDRLRAGQGQGQRQGGVLRRTDGAAGLSPATVRCPTWGLCFGARAPFRLGTVRNLFSESNT